MKQPKILFFIDGPIPTDAERLDAFDLQAQVCFRNAQHVFRVDEECDGVAGSIPEAYKNHQTAEESLKAYKAEIKAARAKLADVGGTPAAAGRRGQTTAPARGGQASPGAAAPTTITQGAAPTDEDAAAAAATALAAGETPPVAGAAPTAAWQGNK